MPEASRKTSEHIAGRPFSLTMVIGAGVCWVGALTLLFLVDLRAEDGPFTLQCVLFYVLVLAASVLTFAPLQQHMELPRLAVEGTTGFALLFHTLAFVPPPNGWLLSLPDLPVYALLITAIFLSTSALVLPFIYALRQRFIKKRAHRLDMRQARRQAYVAGGIAACGIILAGLRMLTWISFLLLVLIVLMVELMMLVRGKVAAKGDGTR